MENILAALQKMGPIELAIIGIVGLAVVGFILRRIKAVFFFAYLAVMLGGLYLVASVALPEVPKPNDTILALGLGAIVIILAVWRPFSLVLNVLRYFILFSGIVALIWHIVSKVLLQPAGGAVAAPIVADANFSFVAGAGAVALAAVVLGIVYFFSRRSFTLKTDRRVHERYEIDDRKDHRTHTRSEIDHNYGDRLNADTKPERGQIFPVKARVKPDKTSARKNPGGEVVMEPKQGKKFTVTGSTSDGRWLRVEVVREAWIAASDLEITEGNLAAVAKVSTQ